MKKEITEQKKKNIANVSGNKKIHNGPRDGKYVIVMCKGEKKKRYLKNV
jgi:hypothetical protein